MKYLCFAHFFNVQRSALIEFLRQKNWVFATNSNFITPISSQSHCINLCYFRLFWSNRIHSLKYQSSTTSCCKKIEMRKSEFVAKTQLLRNIYYFNEIPARMFRNVQEETFATFSNIMFLTWYWLKKKSKL